MKTKKQINAELLLIHELFPSNQTELYRQTPFQLLVAVMLSAQTTDKQVNKVTTKLFQTIKNPQHIINLWEEELMQTIKSLGFYKTKAKHIFQTAHILIHLDIIRRRLTIKEKKLLDKEGYCIPQSLDELVKLPWVGIKTAKVVAHQLYWSLDIGVDTHVHRVSNRLGRVATKVPEQTSKLLEWLIYHKLKKIAHHSLVLFGRYHCKAIKPLCNHCPLSQWCVYYTRLILDQKNKTSNQT